MFGPIFLFILSLVAFSVMFANYLTILEKYSIFIQNVLDCLH